MQRGTVHRILNALFCLQWYSLNSLNTGAKEVGLASKAGGPEAKEAPPKEHFQICYRPSPHEAPLQSNQICALASPALLAEVRLTPQTNSSIICWSKGVFSLPILNPWETWKALKNNLHPKHKCWQILPHLQKNNPLWRSVNILVPFLFLKKRQLSGPQ